MIPREDRALGWKRADDVAYVGRNERVVVLNLSIQGSTPFALEGTGAAIWHALGPSPQAQDEIVTILASAYGVARSAIENDVVAFLNHLRDAGLVIEIARE